MKHTRIFTRHLHSRDCKKRYLKGDYCECLNEPLTTQEKLDEEHTYHCFDDHWVTSMGEREVYEWLKRKGIDFEYECNEHKKLSYLNKDGKEEYLKPDFYIKKAVINGERTIKEVFIEYIGVFEKVRKDPNKVNRDNYYNDYRNGNRNKYKLYSDRKITVICLFPEDLQDPDCINPKEKYGILYKLLNYEEDTINYLPKTMRELMEL